MKNKKINVINNDGIELNVSDVLEFTDLNKSRQFYKIFEVEGGFAINMFQDDFYKSIESINFYSSTAEIHTMNFIKKLKVIGNLDKKFNTKLLIDNII